LDQASVENSWHHALSKDEVGGLTEIRTHDTLAHIFNTYPLDHTHDLCVGLTEIRTHDTLAHIFNTYPLDHALSKDEVREVTFIKQRKCRINLNIVAHVPNLL